MGAGTTSGKNTASAAQQQQYNTPQQILAAKSAVAAIKNQKHTHTTITRPSDGHKLTVDIQKVKQNAGYRVPYAYRITIDDETAAAQGASLSEARIWYTYRDSLADAKKDARRYLGI